jgi:hypothetical protein
MNSHRKMGHKEKRTAERYVYNCPVSFTVLGNSHTLPNDIYNPAETVDISNNGMRIRISRNLREGSVIKVLISIPGQPAKIPVLAEVKWIKGKISKNYQAGLRYVVQ